MPWLRLSNTSMSMLSVTIDQKRGRMPSGSPALSSGLEQQVQAERAGDRLSTTLNTVPAPVEQR